MTPSAPEVAQIPEHLNVHYSLVEAFERYLPAL